MKTRYDIPILAVLVAVLLVILVGCTSIGDARIAVKGMSNGRGYGSGVVVAPGLVLTAKHVAEQGNLVPAGKSTVGEVVGAGKGEGDVDIALLKFPVADVPCPCVTIAQDEAAIDEPVYVIGFPFNVAQVVTTGLSQGVQENVVAPGPFGTEIPLGRRLVLTALAAPGNSGGGVFVIRENQIQLVGILVEAIGPLSFAIPLADIKPLLTEHGI